MIYRRKRVGPGRIRRRLAAMICAKLAEAGLTVRTDPEWLTPNEGFWRCQIHKADVMPWGGSIEVFRHDKWQRCSVQSWETMSELIRGFTIDEESYMYFMLFAEKPLAPRIRFRRSRLKL